MDEFAPIRKRRGRSLPHWTREGSPVFVTMRLHDSLPKSVLDGHRAEIADRIEALERRLERATTEEERVEVRRRCAGHVERFLDSGHGECLFHDPTAATIVHRSFEVHRGARYTLDAWCVMPNHAHVLLTPLAGWTLEKITYDWKHGSARLVNRALGRSGAVWRNESFDHLPRTEDSLARFRRYILDNPTMAGLKGLEFVGVG